MTRFILLTLLVTTIFQFGKAQEVAATSQIDSITLFRAGAQIHRTGAAQIQSGRTEVVFKGLSSEIDENSLRVSGKGDFTILSVSFRRNFLDEKEKNETLKQLTETTYSLEKKISLTKKQLEVFKKEEAFLDKNMVKIVGIQNSPASPTDVEQLADFHRKRMFDVLEKQLEHEETLKHKNDTLNKIYAQINEMKQKQTPPVGEVVVVVNAANTKNARFSLDYFVRSASWQPMYDARVKDVSSPIVLNQKAKINQNTGEDWDKVQLTLSTGNPTLGGTKPDLNPWFLDFHNPYANRGSRKGSYQVESGRIGGHVVGTVRDVNGEPLIGASVLFSGTKIGTATDISGRFKLKIPPNVSTLEISYTGFTSLSVPVTSYAMNVNVYLGEGATLDEVVITGRKKRSMMKGSRSASNFYMVDGIRVQGGLISEKDIGKKDEKAETAEVSVEKALTTFNYTIKIPVTIKSDGKMQTVDIQSFNVPANYQYYAVPKLDKDAFLVGEITNWEQYGLLSAETNLFFEGTFLGKSFLDFESVEDTLAISLGRDKNIIVQRTKMKDFTKKQLLGGNRVDTRTFEISVVNKKSQAIKIRIEDQFPISKNKKIDIDELESSNASVNKETGIVRWDLTLPSNDRKKLRLGYKVKYPKGKRVQLE